MIYIFKRTTGQTNSKSISCLFLVIFFTSIVSLLFFLTVSFFNQNVIHTTYSCLKKYWGLAIFAVLQREARGAFRTRTFLNLVLSQQNNKSPQFQIHEALWRYSELLSLFNRSLINMKKMEMHQKLETVNTDWHQLLDKTKQLLQVSFIFRNNFIKLRNHYNVERRFLPEILKTVLPF